MSRAEGAAATADPRTVRTAKDGAQSAFRAARGDARTQEDVEAAAREWLHQINRINAEAREAAALAVQEREGAGALVVTMERLTVEADAARIAAEAWQEACLAAREALAECEERGAVAVGEPAGPSRAPSGPADLGFPLAGGLGAALGLPDEESVLAAAAGTEEPRILRLLRGDRTAMARLVMDLGGSDPAGRRHWQLAISDLVDAVLSRAIEAASLEFPVDHQFWGLFTRSQCRDIAVALASLGYRFDGLGGWADGRVPSQRDLSLAIGYGGLDPMRIRRWPNEAEMAELFRDVTVAAAEYLAGAAGGLSLGEMVSLLGRRADALADVWNAWGRIRPLLLALD